MSSNTRGIERTVGLLECGRERGTAFLIRDDLIATCRHCILPHLRGTGGNPLCRWRESDPGRNRSAGYPGRARRGVPPAARAARRKDGDAVGRLASPPRSPLGVIRLPGRARAARDVSSREGWIARSMTRQFLVTWSCCATHLTRPQTTRGSRVPRSLWTERYGGLSKSDSTAESARSRSHGSAATSRLASVKFRAIDVRGYVPSSLARELDESIPNWRTFSRLEEELAGPPEGYVVLSGHPGAGKTLISAGFQPADDRMSVVGRYFASGDGGSEFPPAYYRNVATFAQWLSAEASLKSSQAEGVRPDATTAEFARSIAKNLEVICSTIADHNLGILIIDGVEAAPTDTLPSFLEYLPSKPPERLTIVLTTNDFTSLLRKFDQLSVSKEVETLPLPLADCERLIARKLGESIPLSQVVRIAELSEGNPLTLSYYVREIQSAIERGELEPWSVLEGGPDEYYLRVWNRFARDSPAQYLLALTARMRGPIPRGRALPHHPRFAKSRKRRIVQGASVPVPCHGRRHPVLPRVVP